MTRSEMQRKTLENVIARLEGKTATSDKIAAMLADHDMRLWLGSWVTPSLACLNDANDMTRSAYKRAESAQLALSLSGR